MRICLVNKLLPLFLWAQLIFKKKTNKQKNNNTNTKRRNLEVTFAAFFACQGIIDHLLGNLRQGGDKIVNLLVLDVDNKFYTRMKMGCLSPKVGQSLNILSYVCGNQNNVDCVPTSVIPGVLALLCIVTHFIAIRQLEIAFLPLLQLFEAKL